MGGSSRNGAGFFKRALEFRLGVRLFEKTKVKGPERTLGAFLRDF